MWRLPSAERLNRVGKREHPFCADRRIMKPLLRSALLFTYLCTVIISVASEGCIFPLHKTNPEGLKAYQKLKPLLGKRYTVEDAEHSYKYFIGICTNAIAGQKTHQGVVQQELDKETKESKQSVAIGEYTSASIMSGRNWVYLEYVSGEAYRSHCSGETRRAVILFTCDPSATDSSPGMKLLEEEKNKTTGCYYLFELAHPEICDAYSGSSSSLSIGSIILIVLFCVMAVYLIAGVLYQRFVLGAKGIEQIPNYEFWKDFGNLQADGCNFVCRSQDGHHSSPYKGLGDDQLEEPEERDDNLLPM